MLHFGYICRATCELFLFARLSTKNYLFLGAGEWWEWGRERKTVKKKKNSLRELKFLQWAKSVPPLVSAFLLSLPAPHLRLLWGLEGGIFSPASECLHMFFSMLVKFFYNFNPTFFTSDPFNLLKSYPFCRS